MSVKLLKAIVTVLSLSFIFTLTVSADIVTWQGTTNSDWDTGSNWDVGSEPSLSDDVVIPSGLTNYPLITSTGNIVQSVDIKSGAASLSIAIAGELTLQDATGTGLVSEGNLTIDGTLNIINATFSGLSNIGEITINGMLNISNTQGFSGFDHAPDATTTVINNGTLHITDSGNSGLRCSKGFENNGTIIIDGNHPEIALFSSDSFVNSGEITIDVTNNPTDGAIFNAFNSFANNSCALITANKHINHTGASFTNDGVIVLTSVNDNTGTIANNGIINKANGDVVLLTTGSGVVYDNLTTNVWTACGGDTDWDKADNWSLGIEPNTTDDVIIPNGLTNYPLIESTGNTVQSISITGASSSLEVGSDAELTILDALGTGLYSEGIALILGTLNITDSTGEGLVNVGELVVHANGLLEVTGTLGLFAIENTNDGTEIVNMGIINIVDSGSEGLANGNDFMNLGEINISGSHNGTAFSNAATFDNFGEITINVTNFPEGGGMINNSTFTNDACSRVTTNRHIENTTGTFDNKGILLLNGPVANLGTFLNDGLIYNPGSAPLTTTGTGVVYTNLTTLVWTGCMGTTDWDSVDNWSLEVEPDATYDVVVTDQMGGSSPEPVIISTSANTAKSVDILATGELQIETTGTLSISNSPNYGLRIRPSGTFLNEGILSISNSEEDGLRNESSNPLINSGEINITDSGLGDDGIFNQTGSSFTNTGTINIEGTQPESGIDNRAAFTNEGEINIITSNSPTNGSIDNTATFNNSVCATLAVNDEIDNSGATGFNNNGVLTSTFNGSNAGTIDNHGVIYNTNGGTFTTSGLSNGFEFTSEETTVWTNCSEVNTSWGNDGNWTADAPNGFKDAIIPAGVPFYPIITEPVDVNLLTIEVGADLANQSTLNAQTIDNTGHLINGDCESVINISSNLTNNTGGEITNIGRITLLGSAAFTDNGGNYTGNAVGDFPPSILYVDLDATSGANDGSSWEDAYLDLQDALLAAATCPVEIWVAEGGYFPTPSMNRNISFNLPDGVELYGGFAGTETARSDRDFVNNVTILSGDIGVDNDDTDNSFQVVRAGEDKVVKLDGFTIADGNADEIIDEVIQNDGGGFYNLGEATVQNCIFTNNRATDKGAAIYNDNDNIRIVNCIFRANIGDAIYNDNCNLSLINTVVSGNDGNGVSHVGTTSVQVLNLDNCTIVGNDGHGVYLDETSLNAVNSIFWDNEVGGLQNEMAQISTTTFATVSFSCIEGGWSGDGSSNISTDPLFEMAIDPLTSPTNDGDFSLQITSSAINAGNNASLQTDISDVDDDENDTEIIDIDLANNVRIQLTTLDMGAYEASESCSVDGINAYWTGEISVDWNDPANWCPAFVPTTNDNVFIGTLTVVNQPSIAVNTSIKSLTLSNSSVLTIEGGFNLEVANSDDKGIFMDSSTIHNHGIVSVHNSNDDGIKLVVSSVFNNNNNALLEIYNIPGNGLVVDDNSDLNNNSGANLTIENATENGLMGTNNGEITNGGEISILGVIPEKKLIIPQSISIGVGSTLYNLQCASLSFDDVFENAGTVATDGFIHANGNTFLNTGTFLGGLTNIIFDPNDLFVSPGGTFTNSGTVFSDEQPLVTTNIWTACGGNTSWDDTENWSLEVIPTATQDVLIPDLGVSVDYPQLNSTQIVQSVVIENNASLTVGDISGGLLDIDGGSNGLIVEVGGMLILNSLGTMGIVNSTNDGIENQGTITIEGSLSVGQSTDRDIYNYGDFNIGTDGFVQIDADGNHGILNTLDGEWTNDGSMFVYHNATSIGIENNTDAIFTNNSVVFTNKGAGTGDAIKNLDSAEMANSSCGIIDTEGQITSSSIFENEGFLMTTFNGTNTISGTFTNDGVISDEFDSFNGFAGITNNSLLIQPIAVCLGGSLENPLIDGGTTLTIGENWLNSEIEGTGGTYNDATDTFTPAASLGVGVHMLEIPIENETFECTTSIPIKVSIEECTLVWTGGSDPVNTDWNDPNNWSTGVVPTSTDDVAIGDIDPLTNYPIINTNIETHSLTIELSADIEVASGGSLIIEDGLTNNGSFTNNGSVDLLGGNLSNNGTFFNQTCAVLELQEIIQNAGTFTNDGILHSSTTVNHENLNIDAVFNNSGILYDNGILSPFITGGIFNDTGKLLNDANINVWTGCNGDNDWSNASNWSLGFVPSFDAVIIPDISPSTDYPSITSTGNFIASLVIEDGGILTVEDGGEFSVFNFESTSIDIEEGGTLNIDSGGIVNVLDAPFTGVNVDGTLNVNGDLLITTTGIGLNVGATGVVNDEGLIQILEGAIPEKAGTGLISVVNFLEIQNGSTFEVKAGGSLIIDGTAGGGAEKKLLSDGDTGIKIFSGGTLLSEATGTIEVINISGTGIDNGGEVDHSGDMTITAEDIGITTSDLFTNGGSADISKPEGLLFAAKTTGGASVVNFLEIQNGSTFEVLSGGSLTIDGSDVGPSMKSGVVNDDTGIDVKSGGTFTSETNTTIEVINMSGLSTGIVNNGNIDNAGDMNVTIESTGIQVQSGMVENSGDITLSKIEGLAFAAKKTGGASVVNFLEIQNGSTFEVLSGGSLTVDGSDVGPSMKSGLVNDDTGIDVKSGGTFTTETNTTTEVINMSGLSTGIVNNGNIDNAGDMNVTIESTGIQVQSGTVENSGNINLSKIDGLTFAAKKTGGASVVNFLEIQNGSTFEVLSGGSLVIDGSDTGAGLKTGLLSNDTGIDISTGGTLTTEANSTVEVINMLVGSRGVVNGGDIDNTGTMSITTENLGMEVQTGGTVDNDGTINISKVGLGLVDIVEDPEGVDTDELEGYLPNSLSKKGGGVSVVNFLEIQNGSTFEVLAGGSLIIDGQEEVALKSNTKKGLLNDTGIRVYTGGTFISQPTSNVDVINMIGASIGVSTSGTVTNDGDFEITTEGRGVEVVEGTFDNGGDLEISKIEGLTLLGAKSGSGSVVNFLEIQNGSTFEVQSGGSLVIDGQSTLSKAATNFSNDTGITVQTGGTFDAKTNSTVDVLNMIGTSTGVVNSGEIFDGGDFTITTENIGMQVDANTVQVTGTLTITTVDAPAKSLGKKGKISVVNFLEIQNGSTFEVLSGGEVTVDGGAGPAKSSGLLNDVGVTIDSGGELFTEEQALFVVKNFAGEESVGMRNNGLVDNSGTVNIEEVDGNGLENNEDFNNSDCAVFITDSKVNNSTNGDISNNGLISSTYGESGGKHQNDGSIVNQGVIEDPNEAFVNIIGNPVIELGDGSTNTYTLFNALTTCFGENVENATNKPLDIGGLFSINMWYTDITLSQIAAVYIGSTNTLVPLYGVLGPGTHTLYVSVSSDKFEDCGVTNVVLVELTILPLPEVIPLDQGVCIGDETMDTPLAVEDMGDEYTWYDAEVDGSMLTTGTTYTPDPLPTTTTTYWVQAIGENCSSDGRTAVTLTVHDLPEIPIITSPTDFEFCQNETTLIDAGVYDANHSYTWSTSEITQSISVGIEQAYTVTITNENGCTSTASAGVSVSVIPLEIEDDMGFCIGELSILDAGTYTANDTYNWSTGSTSQTIEVDEGIYTVTVTNVLGCPFTATTAVTPETCCIAVAGTLTVETEELCAGDDIVVSTNGTEDAPLGYEQYFLLVNKTSGKIEDVNTTGVFSDVDADDYEIYSYVELIAMPPIPSPVGSSNLLVTAIGETDEGCFELSTPETVIMPPEPAVEIVFSNTEGPTATITIASITVTGGTSPYTADFTYSGGTATFLNNFATGVYTVSSWGNATWDLTITDDKRLRK